MARAGWRSWLLLLALELCGASEKPAKKAPTLAPGDGRKRDWPAILEHIELEWVEKVEDCARDGKDGDSVAFNHKGFIAELPPGKTTDGEGRQLQIGMQIDSNMDPATKEAKPLEFVLGTPRLIVGMEAVLRSMCEGETVRAMIPGPLAFNWKGNFLPYNTKVLYEMELVSFEKGTGLPKETPPEASAEAAATSPVAETSWTLALGLLVLLVLVLGGAAFAMQKLEQQAQTNKKVKKEGKKKK